MKNSSPTEVYINFFDEIHLSDIKSVGGKNASLGEMYNSLSDKGIKVPYGFATTVNSYWEFIYSNKLKERIAELLAQLDKKDFSNLKMISEQIIVLIKNSQLPDKVKREITKAYTKLSDMHGSIPDVAHQYGYGHGG